MSSDAAPDALEASGRRLAGASSTCPAPSSGSSSPRPALNDLASNLELMAARRAAGSGRVEQILRDAAVAPHEPVMLVGHSQGGMVPPPGVQLLALENRYGLVPRADGRETAEGQVTVVFGHQTGTVSGNHSTGEAYAPAAQALDSSADEAVRAWLAGADAFLIGNGERTAATTTVCTVTYADDDG